MSYNIRKKNFLFILIKVNEKSILIVDASLNDQLLCQGYKELDFKAIVTDRNRIKSIKG